MHTRSVIHLNVADFAVAVERQVDSRLRKRPVIIAPEAAARAAVFDMSEEAYRTGVRKGMPLRRARGFCRDALILPPRPERYELAMRRFFKTVACYSPRVEIADLNGHLFMDVTGTSRLFGPPQDIASRIRKTVHNDIGLNPIWSVATNKLVAKVATRLVKPSGEYIVRPGDEEAFFRPLPMVLIPGIPKDDIRQLEEFNLCFAGQAAILTPAQLDLLFGHRGKFLYDTVRGTDSSPVLENKRQPMIHVSHLFGSGTTDISSVENGLYRIVEDAGARLRGQRRHTGRTRVMIGWSDGKESSGQEAVQPPASDDFALFASSSAALRRAWVRRLRVRQISLLCDCLSPASLQLELFGTGNTKRKKTEALMEALDSVRCRFGTHAVRTGRVHPIQSANSIRPIQPGTAA